MYEKSKCTKRCEDKHRQTNAGTKTDRQRNKHTHAHTHTHTHTHTHAHTHAHTHYLPLPGRDLGPLTRPWYTRPSSPTSSTERRGSRRTSTTPRAPAPAPPPALRWYCWYCCCWWCWSFSACSSRGDVWAPPADRSVRGISLTSTMPSLPRRTEALCARRGMYGACRWLSFVDGSSGSAGRRSKNARQGKCTHTRTHIKREREVRKSQG